MMFVLWPIQLQWSRDHLAAVTTWQGDHLRALANPASMEPRPFSSGANQDLWPTVFLAMLQMSRNLLATETRRHP